MAMAKPEHDGINGPALDACWPGFLDALDQDPRSALDEFCRFALRLLKTCPPGPLRSLDQDQRDDIVHDVVLHCCSQDFRILRGYRDRGRPFAAWLQLVARNKALDLIRRRNLAPMVPLETDDDRPDRDPIGSEPAPDEVVDRRQVLAKVQAALQQMSENCRLLLKGAAEGYKPREVVKLMGWPADMNKKVSDDLRACRTRLVAHLARAGLDESDLRPVGT